MSKNGKHLFTSESVTEGHPDKVCDQISDSILDDLLSQDPKSRVACETLVTTGLVLIAGEISSRGYTDLQKVVRKTVRELGYVKASYGFDYETNKAKEYDTLNVIQEKLTNELSVIK